MENEEEEKIDKITGQKESEIPVFKEGKKTIYQNRFFLLTKFDYDENLFEIIGLFSEGILARKRMDKEILNDGYFPSDIEFGSPERVKIKKIIYDDEEEIEYKISQVLVDQ